jgi:hypothetical protein
MKDARNAGARRSFMQAGNAYSLADSGAVVIFQMVAYNRLDCVYAPKVPLCVVHESIYMHDILAGCHTCADAAIAATVTRKRSYQATLANSCKQQLDIT